MGREICILLMYWLQSYIYDSKYDAQRSHCSQCQCANRGAMQDDFPLHWPLINSDHMRTRLAKRELEKKRIEDSKR